MAMSETFKFRVQPEERARWQAAADREGVSLAAWLRLAAEERALGRPAPALTPEEREVLGALVFQVRRIGLNLNQLLHGIRLAELGVEALPERQRFTELAEGFREIEGQLHDVLAPPGRRRQRRR